MDENTVKQSSSRITPRHEDFSEWYHDIIAQADLAEHSGIKGSMIIKPYGYALWENIQKVLDAKIKETGHENAYFPLLIPESYLKKEAQHVEGFAPELAVVTHAGGEKLEEPLVVRPTSETIINASFSRWVQSWRDLPLLINQWANVVRWELRPRLFLRTTEFLWQEGHTAHATQQEAQEEQKKMLDVYTDLAENYMAMPVIDGEKSAAERFAGAESTYTIEAMMQDGKALQAGTSHALGQNFAKAFDITFSDKDGTTKHVWTTSWGVSTRLIGGLIMTHSDDDGLVLPPNIAPTQVVIIPIGRESDLEQVVTAANNVAEKLKQAGVTVRIDTRDNYTPGHKFNEWEKKGVPVRLELGPRDLAADQVVVVRRDTKDKETVGLADVTAKVKQLLEDIQKNLYYQARLRRDERTFTIDDYATFQERIEHGAFLYAHWCGSEECEKQIKDETKATIRCIPFDQPAETGTCIKCGGASHKRALFARAY
ncbi:MAG TPA: proline--tRNA ligase [Patescibacteria group bacterium]